MDTIKSGNKWSKEKDMLWYRKGSLWLCGHNRPERVRVEEGNPKSQVRNNDMDRE